MITSCQCPPGASLPDIPESNCPVSMGQIQKLIFMRRSATAVFTTGKAAEELASWTPLLTASDSTKVVVTPYVENPELNAGDPLTTGGGNASLNGAEKVIGSGPGTFSGVFNEIEQKVAAAIKQLRCEDLAVAFITADGRIWLKELTAESFGFIPTVYRTFHVGDLTGGKLDELSSNSIQFSLPAGYSDSLTPIVPKFDALTELVNK